MANKKKKKQAAKARKPSYATGKAPGEKPAKKGPVRAVPATAGKGATGASQKPGTTKPGTKAKAAPQQPQFNLIKKGSLEMKVYLVLLAVIAVATLLQYPLAIQDANNAYAKLKKQYPVELKKFQEKYKTPAEQKTHASEKPAPPRKPTFSDFLLYQALFLFIQGALFAFLALNVQRRTDLGTPFLDKAVVREAKGTDVRDLFAWSIPFGLAALVPPLLSTWIGKSLGFIKGSEFKKTPAWKYALSYVNIAISNQILFTFLVVTVLVYVFAKYHEKVRLEPHWAAIIGATIIQFGYIYWVSNAAGESPGTSAIGAGFLALSLVALLGYLYWRKGLEYSLLAGVIGFGLYPFLARLIIK
ncbi:MAG TPA: hypothetical protein VIK15_02905 [Candidatus Anoxymicrobiaceae bacterium]